MEGDVLSMTVNVVSNRLTNSREMVRKIADATGMSSYAVGKVLDAASTVMLDELAAGHAVRLKGIGTFDVVEKPARKVWVPSKNETVSIGARRVPRMKPSPDMRRRVREPGEGD